MTLFSQLVLVFWQALTSGLRVFAVDSVRDGLVNVRPLRPSGRVLIGISLVVIFGFLTATIFSTLLRSTMDLEPLAISSSTSRGLLVPSAAIAAMLIGLVLAWSFILTGALRMVKAVRTITCVCFLLFGAQALNSGLTSTVTIAVTQPLLSAALSVVSWGSFVMLAASALALPRMRLPLAVDFSVILVLLTLFTLPSIAAFVAAQSGAMQIPVGLADSLSDALMLTAVLLTPFRLISGLELANLAQALSSAAVKSVRRHLSQRALFVAMGAALAVRLGIAVNDLADQTGFNLQRFFGASILTAGIGILAWIYRTRRAQHEVPFRAVVTTVAAFTVVNMALIPLMQAVVSALVAVGMVSGDLQAVAPVVDRTLQVFNQVSDFYSMNSRLLLAIGAAMAAAMLWRKRSEVSSFLAALAWLSVWQWATSTAQPLAALRWELAEFDLVCLIAMTLLALWRAVRKSLTIDFAARVLGVCILFAVLYQTDFLDNPFSPLSGVAAVLILVVGIAWNVITSGGRFLNADSAEFPRMSRALMYFGYVMLTTGVTFWFVVSHTVWQQSLSSSIARTGFELFGIGLVTFVLVNGAESLDGADA